MPELTALMDEVFATRTLEQWGSLFDEQGFIWAPASSVAELAADQQAAAIGLFPVVEHAAFGPFQTVASPIRIAGAESGPRGPAPEVGQHTAQVLAELGLPEQEVAALAAAGVIGTG